MLKNLTFFNTLLLIFSFLRKTVPQQIWSFPVIVLPCGKPIFAIVGAVNPVICVKINIRLKLAIVFFTFRDIEPYVLAMEATTGVFRVKLKKLYHFIFFVKI